MTMQSRRTACVSSAALLLTLGAVHAVDAERPMRDPTVPPIALLVTPPAGAALSVAAAPAASATASGVAAARAPGQPRYILVVDGQRYVIDAGRRRSVGDALGNARIERIDDSAIWVREAGALQRLPMFGPAVRRAAAPSGEPPPAAPATARAPAPGGRPSSPSTQPGEPS